MIRMHHLGPGHGQIQGYGSAECNKIERIPVSIRLLDDPVESQLLTDKDINVIAVPPLEPIVSLVAFDPVFPKVAVNHIVNVAADDILHAGAARELSVR